MLYIIFLYDFKKIGPRCNSLFLIAYKVGYLEEHKGIETLNFEKAALGQQHRFGVLEMGTVLASGQELFWQRRCCLFNIYVYVQSASITVSLVSCPITLASYFLQEKSLWLINLY